MNTEERTAGFGPNERCGDLLSITSSKGGLKAEVATILGAQQFFHESGAPKRSACTHAGPCFVIADRQESHCSHCVDAPVAEVDLGVMVLSHLANEQIKPCAVKQGGCMALCCKIFVATCRLMQRLLEDLVDCGSVTYEAVQDWQHDNRDETPGKEAAIKDSAKLVASLAAKDAENTDINN